MDRATFNYLRNEIEMAKRETASRKLERKLKSRLERKIDDLLETVKHKISELGK